MVSINHCKVVFEDNDHNQPTRYNVSDVTFEKENAEKCTLADNGFEIILNDGRLVGHRSLCLYYKQRFYLQKEEDEEDTNQKAVENGGQGGELIMCRRQHDMQMKLLPKGKNPQQSSRPNNCVRQARVSK